MQYTSKFAISQIIIHQTMLYELLRNLIGSLLLYYDFILHRFTFYGALSCSYCMDLPNFMVDSIDSSAVCGQLQFFRSMQLSSLYQQ